MHLAIPEITFVEDGHKYYVDGKEKVYPSKVLKDLGLSKNYGDIDPAVVENAARRGSGVHKALELHVKGEIDNYEISETIVPYYEAFKRFVSEKSFKPFRETAELKRYSRIHDYCTTIDIVGEMEGRKVVIDYKTSSVFDRAVELQTAAQEIAYNEWAKEGQKVEARYSLQLLKTGKYRLREHTNIPTSHWVNALTLWKWKYE